MSNTRVSRLDSGHTPVTCPTSVCSVPLKAALSAGVFLLAGMSVWTKVGDEAAEQGAVCGLCTRFCDFSMWPLPLLSTGGQQVGDASVPVAAGAGSAVHVFAQLEIHFSAFTGREMCLSDVQLRTEFKKVPSG